MATETKSKTKGNKQADSDIAYARIFPPIAIARVGDSEDEFITAPNSPPVHTGQMITVFATPMAALSAKQRAFASMGSTQAMRSFVRSQPRMRRSHGPLIWRTRKLRGSSLLVPLHAFRIL